MLAVQCSASVNYLPDFLAASFFAAAYSATRAVSSSILAISVSSFLSSFFWNFSSALAVSSITGFGLDFFFFSSSSSFLSYSSRSASNFFLSSFCFLRSGDFGVSAGIYSD